MNYQKFQSPDEIYDFINTVIAKLNSQGLDSEPLRDIQHTAFTTSSEWLGELELAIKKIEKQDIKDESVKADLERIICAIHGDSRIYKTAYCIKTFFNKSFNLSVLICLFLVISSFAVYFQVINHEFIAYDDELYVTDNIHVKAGLTIKSIISAFNSTTAANWHPVTMLSHMLDVELFGMKPGCHHLTNLIFHIANTLLLFFVLEKITKKLWESGFVSALFALHPLHV
jgi:hypothetical protein